VGLLAGLDAFLVALTLLVAMLVTAQVLRPLLVSVLSQAPFIGGWLASNVDAGLARFQSSITGPANASMGIIVSSLLWLVGMGRGLLQVLQDLPNAIWGSINTLATVTLPHAVGLATSHLEGLVTDARNAAAAGLAGLAASVGADLAAARAEAVTLTTAARADALAASGAVQATVEGELAQAEKTAGSLFTQAEADAGAALGLAEQTLTGMITQARADALAAAGAVESDVQRLAAAAHVLVADSASVLGGDIAAAEARAGQALSSLGSTVQGEIDSVIKSGPWGGLVQLYEGGEAALAAKVETLVIDGLAAIRSELGSVEAIRAKYGPEIAAATARLRAGQ